LARRKYSDELSSIPFLKSSVLIVSAMVKGRIYLMQPYGQNSIAEPLVVALNVVRFGRYPNPCSKKSAQLG
jgi:hypothetical protein